MNDNNLNNNPDNENNSQDNISENPSNNPYNFNSDGTYHFSGANKSDENSSGAEKNEYPYSEPQSASNEYPYNQYGTGGNGQNFNSSAYPHAQNRSDTYYAYQQGNDNNGGKKGKSGKVFVGIVCALCLVLIAALIFVVNSNNTTKTPKTEEPTLKQSANVGEIETSASPLTAELDSTGAMTSKAIYQKVLPSSVGIIVYDSKNSIASEGSGVIFTEDKDGKYTYIITCAHVIADAKGGILIQTYDGSEYKAEVVGFDTKTDIGVLRIEAKGLTAVEIGDSKAVAVGDSVYAIGNPGGSEFANSFTNGMVSALDRPVSSSSTGYTMECIQHTAAINPGNSGGALINSFGQLIGINSMKIVADEYEGMGFSVPSSVFVDIVNQIIANGYVANRPKLGITYVPASKYESYGMFVAIKGLPAGSIVIYSISEDSALANTKAKVNDMIVAVNGQNLDDASYLSELIEKSKVGDVLTFSIVRINSDYSYEEFEVKATLVEDRGDTILTQEEETTTPNYEDFFKEYFGDYFGDYFGGNR